MAVTSFVNGTYQECALRSTGRRRTTERPPSYVEVECPLSDDPVQITADIPKRRRCLAILHCQRFVVFIISFVTMLIFYVALCGLMDLLVRKELKDLFAHMFSFTILYLALGVIYK